MIPTGDTHDGDHRTWVDVCAVDDIQPERGVAVLIGGRQVAVFRVALPFDRGELLRAVDHRDPFTGANVLARGIVGSTADQLYVASPLHKQRFDLETGVCLDDEALSVQTWPARAAHGRVLVAVDATLE